MYAASCLWVVRGRAGLMRARRVLPLASQENRHLRDALERERRENGEKIAALNKQLESRSGVVV